MLTHIVYARRLNKLYPLAPALGTETRLDKALRKGLDPKYRITAEKRLRRLMPDAVFVDEEWWSATTLAEHDCQRAILLLKADNNPCFRLLEEAPVTDERVARVMKEIPYFHPSENGPSSSMV